MIINPYIFGPSFDPDAQAFITAAAITDPTQQNAINTLVVDLKGYSIWTKFKAIYPIVGGSASSHKFNLKDPRDLDAAFRLTYATGITHSANGMVGNGTTGFANTYFKPSINNLAGSSHLSYYSRTLVNESKIEMGCYNSSNYNQIAISFGGTTYCNSNNALNDIDVNFASNSQGFFIASRTSATAVMGQRNLTQITGTSNEARNAFNIYICAINQTGFTSYYSTKQCAFASIGDGLTDTDAANFYTAVQAYQTTLGRSIGTQTVSDADAQAFINAAAIDDQVQANAINDLVIGMKADGLWTKMKAIYPIVGGTASSHKFNLKDPRDLDAAYRLTFATGWTHSANGMTTSGSSYSNTFLNPVTNLTNYNAHQSVYCRLDGGNLGFDIGSTSSALSYNQEFLLASRRSGQCISALYNYTQAASEIVVSIATSKGLTLASITSNSISKLYKNSTIIGSNTSLNASIPAPFPLYIGGVNDKNTAVVEYTNNQYAFASIGDGLTDTEATNYYNRVQTYQTTLSRQV